MNSRTLTVALIVLFVSVGYASAAPVELRLVNVGPGYNDGSYYVFPYNFSINGSIDLVSLLCDDFNDDIYFGETWMAKVFGLADIFAGQGQMTPKDGLVANGDRVTAYKDAAWLYRTLESNLTPGNAVAINHTIWSLFAPTPFSGSADVATWFAAATAATSSLTNQQAITMFQDVTFFTPIMGTQPNGYGRPQEMLGRAGTEPYRPNAPVPETDSFFLLGMGLFGLALVVNGKRVCRLDTVQTRR